MNIPVLIALLVTTQQTALRYSNAEAGVFFEYPPEFHIVEESRDASGCNWFVTLTNGAKDEIRINCTGNTFDEVARSESFVARGGRWTFDGKAAVEKSGVGMRFLESHSGVVLGMIPARPCSAVFLARGATASRAITGIAQSFRFRK